MGVENIPTRRRGLRCIFCKRAGGCIQCTMGKCATAFHLVCGCQHGLQLNIEQTAERFRTSAICPKHKRVEVQRKMRHFDASAVTEVCEKPISPNFRICWDFLMFLRTYLLLRFMRFLHNFDGEELILESVKRR
jgi:hypothetical protein